MGEQLISLATLQALDLLGYVGKILRGWEKQKIPHLGDLHIFFASGKA